MKIPFEGGCSCGAIRFECSAEPLAMVNCHCRSCQYATGSSHATGVILSSQSFRVTKGEPRSYEKQADSGNMLKRIFCADCGSPLYSENATNPDIVVLRAPALDDPSEYKPQMDIFTDDAQPWDCMDPDLPKYPGMPPM